MLRNFVTYDELAAQFPYVKNRPGFEPQTITDALNAAALEVGAVLRRRGFDPRRIYTPLAIASGQEVEARSESRLVVTGSTGSVTVALEGRRGTGWIAMLGYDGVPVLITVQPDETRSVPFFGGSCEYRISVDGAGAFDAYLVDTGADNAIKYQAIANLMFALAGRDETARTLYANALNALAAELDAMQLDIDTDEDGDISIAEAGQTRGALMWR